MAEPHSTPPIAPKEPKRIEAQGDVRIDDYFWLRERENPAVRAYVEAENAYMQAVMAHTAALQETLYQEMRGRIQEDDSSVPERIDGWYYYRRTEEGKQYPIYCRKQGNLDAPEEVLLDQNQLAAGHDFCDMGVYRISPNHKLLAFSVDYAGTERFTLQVKDLTTGALLPDTIPDTFYSVEWAADNQTLFYNKQDAAWRPYKVFRHRLGSDPAADPLVFHEDNESYWLQLYKSKDQRYILLDLHSSTTKEVQFIPADQPAAAPTVIHPREHKLEYSVEHHPTLRGGGFVIMTNWDAENFRVMTAPVDAPGKENWQELIPLRPAVKVEGVEPFADYLVIHERENGLRQIRVIDLATDQEQLVTFPEPVYNYDRHTNPEFDTTTLRFTYNSLTTPDTVFDYNMVDGTRVQRKQQAVLGGYDPANYVTERRFATARDGTQVPISLVRHKATPVDQPAPLLLYGYGSYGACIDPYFAASRVSLLDRGMVYAIAHIRGGGEMGRPWYLHGKLLHKMNTFTDFVDCAQSLVDAGVTTPETLTVMGRSAGGLLMGAVVNLRPDLFKAVIAGVPFVDVINTVLDPTIPLTVIEWEEWGNPNKPDEYAYMRAYSPYDNLEAKAYPHILATAGFNDSRVQYWEPAKWVAKLRTLKTDNNRLLLKTNMGAGHAGSSGRFDYLKETAFEYAFLLDVLGIA
ncbi:MAG TPA: S9 family peptidase [Caldilineaceae bacterium]|nr:S9 family peptidase [Caldilineaceae bacterium]